MRAAPIRRLASKAPACSGGFPKSEGPFSLFLEMRQLDESMA
jgi:hypothetical protein